MIVLQKRRPRRIRAIALVTVLLVATVLSLLTSALLMLHQESIRRLSTTDDKTHASISAKSGVAVAEALLDTLANQSVSLSSPDPELLEKLNIEILAAQNVSIKAFSGQLEGGFTENLPQGWRGASEDFKVPLLLAGKLGQNGTSAGLESGGYFYVAVYSTQGNRTGVSRSFQLDSDALALKSFKPEGGSSRSLYLDDDQAYIVSLGSYQGSEVLVQAKLGANNPTKGAVCSSNSYGNTVVAPKSGSHTKKFTYPNHMLNEISAKKKISLMPPSKSLPLETLDRLGNKMRGELIAGEHTKKPFDVSGWKFDNFLSATIDPPSSLSYSKEERATMGNYFGFSRATTDEQGTALEPEDFPAFDGGKTLKPGHYVFIDHDKVLRFDETPTEEAVRSEVQKLLSGNSTDKLISKGNSAFELKDFNFTLKGKTEVGGDLSISSRSGLKVTPNLVVGKGSLANEAVLKTGGHLIVDGNIVGEGFVRAENSIYMRGQITNAVVEKNSVALVAKSGNIFVESPDNASATSRPEALSVLDVQVLKRGLEDTPLGKTDVKDLVNLVEDPEGQLKWVTPDGTSTGDQGEVDSILRKPVGLEPKQIESLAKEITDRLKDPTPPIAPPALPADPPPTAEQQANYDTRFAIYQEEQDRFEVTRKRVQDARKKFLGYTGTDGGRTDVNLKQYFSLRRFNKIANQGGDLDSLIERINSYTAEDEGLLLTKTITGLARQANEVNQLKTAHLVELGESDSEIKKKIYKTLTKEIESQTFLEKYTLTNAKRTTDDIKVRGVLATLGEMDSGQQLGNIVIKSKGEIVLEGHLTSVSRGKKKGGGGSDMGFGGGGKKDWMDHAGNIVLDAQTGTHVNYVPSVVGRLFGSSGVASYRTVFYLEHEL